MDFDKPLLPISKKMYGNTIAEDIIGFAADESWEHAVWRHKVEQRVKKINKIKNNLSKNTLIKD
jgi:hypothetical protein